MKQTLIYLVLSYLAVAATPVTLYAAESANRDEAAIRSQIAAYAAARQQGNGPAQSQFYTEDADEWPSFAREMVRGREAIAKTLAFVPPVPIPVVKFEPIQISFLQPEIALVDTHYGSGGEPAGHAFYVMVKKDGQWLIRSARIVRFPPPPIPGKKG